MVYKVFLADDEIVVREGIRNNFPWDDTPFALCGEAPDGEIALPMIQELRPDILVTDIRMPFMDGLALCRNVAATMPWTRIVILSGYDDFEYAREAISLGVKEYLLKPVNAKTLRQALERIAGMIDEEREQQANLDALRGQLSESSRYRQEQRLLRVFDGVYSKSDKARLGGSKSKPGGEPLPLDASYYSVIIIVPGESNSLNEARHVLRRLSEGSNGRMYYAERGAQLWALTLGDAPEDIEERAYAYAQTIAYEAERIGGEQPRIAIGSIVNSLADVPRSVDAARIALQALSASGQRILGIGDVSMDMPPELMGVEVVPLYDKLRYASVAEVPSIVGEYFDSLGGMAAQSLLVSSYALVDILLAGSRVIKQAGGDPARILPEALSQARLLGSVRTLEDILRAANDILTRALTYRDEQSVSRNSALIRKACAYIEENFHRPEMTLHDAASHVALSNNHFCTVFSQEMGVTFIEYLTRLRMDKARAYLRSTDLRSQDIAERIGYADVHYFRYLFKKSTGMSPRDYRGQLIQNSAAGSSPPIGIKNNNTKV
ncbi:MAG: response regulator [Oscillospiraceae bacterium]|jgi:two-component system response regulator YesN|nr:response regulator [Oscillospiraceae bacterium]